MANQTRSAEPSEEYRNFEELTKKLLRVPKKEVDCQKAAYEKKKKSGRGNGSANGSHRKRG